MQHDPRLIEVRLLASLDANATSGSSIKYHKPNPYGGEARLVHECWLELARALAVAGDWTPASVYQRHPDLHPDPERELKQVAVATVERLESHQSVGLRITHAGRLRLSRLRQELDGGRIRDKFGILFDDRHWSGDLQVRVWMRRPGEPLSIIVSDLDHFKNVNDTLGHDVGDQGIRLYRSIVRELVAAHGGDGYAMGGDEAAVVLPGVGSEAAGEVAENIRRAVEESFRTFGAEGGHVVLAVQPTASIGVGTFTASVEPDNARQKVDGLMYQAKKEGRNRIVRKIFDS